MPKKPNSWGNMQEYVPAGNGDASGEYADDEGHNIHFFAKFEKPKSNIEPAHKPEDILKSEKPEQEQKEIKLTAKTEKSSLDKYVSQQKKMAKEIKPSDMKTIFSELYTNELDIEKVKGLSDKEIKDLAIAMNVLFHKDEIIGQEAKYIDKAKQKFLDDTDFYEKYSSMWLHVPDTPSGLKESIDKKLEYFKNKGDDESVAKLEQLKEAIANSKDFKKWEDGINVTDKSFAKYQALFDKYQNPDYAYSDKKKDEAFWAKNKAQSSSKFSAIAEKKIAEWKEKSPQAIADIKKYTGSYSAINYPLRNMDYPHKSAYPEQSKAKQKEFISTVENMTKVLDDSTYDFDCWVQRGVQQLSINGNTLKSGGNISDLKGTTFKDNGFLSCGSSKGAGFSGQDIIMNIYCPKGTKMLYVKSISHFANEDETIIQRGYTYKITKAEKSGGKIYLDCEVILGSDATKYDKKQLTELASKHF